MARCLMVPHGASWCIYQMAFIGGRACEYQQLCMVCIQWREVVLKNNYYFCNKKEKRNENKRGQQFRAAEVALTRCGTHLFPSSSVHFILIFKWFLNFSQ